MWLADITERWTREGKLYPYAIKDVCSNRIVGYSIDSTATTWSGRWAASAQSGDNAAMKPFFSLLQKNVLDRRSWNTREELRIGIVTWIERTYHSRRRQAALGRLTPIEYQPIMTATAIRAA